MKKLFSICILASLLSPVISCKDASGKKSGSQEEWETEIMAADDSMSAMAQKDGFFTALGSYADSAFVKMNQGSLPVIGKSKYIAETGNSPGPKTLSWKPEQATVSENGDMGFTWGYWKFERTDTTQYGTYVTIWKKNKEGKWRMLLDGGNDTPKPE